MKLGVELIIHKGRTIPQNVKKCVKCGKAISSLDEYEKVRKIIRPNLIERVKSFFSDKIECVDILKGKVL